MVSLQDDREFMDHLRAYGRDTVSFQAVEVATRIFRDRESFVPFVDTGRVWLAVGSPLGPEGERSAVMQHFFAQAQSAKRRGIFVATESEAPHSISHLKIGSEPIWDPVPWLDANLGRASFKEQLRRSRAKGVRVERLDFGLGARGEVRREIEALLARWSLIHSMAPMKFLVDTQLFCGAKERRFFAARRGESLVAFLVMSPIYAGRGFFLQHLIRSPDAVNGTTELLFARALRYAKEQNIAFVSTGLVPLAQVASPWSSVAKKALRRFYNFGGLEQFKLRLRPTDWKPVYLSYETSLSASFALRQVLRACAGGSFRRYAAKSVVHNLRRQT